MAKRSTCRLTCGENPWPRALRRLWVPAVRPASSLLCAATLRASWRVTRHTATSRLRNNNTQVRRLIFFLPGHQKLPGASGTVS